MASLQFNKIGFDKKENIWLLVCSEAVESKLVKQTGDNSHTVKLAPTASVLWRNSYNLIWAIMKFPLSGTAHSCFLPHTADLGRYLLLDITNRQHHHHHRSCQFSFLQNPIGCVNERGPHSFVSDHSSKTNTKCLCRRKITFGGHKSKE